MSSMSRNSREHGELEIPRDRAGLVRYLATLAADVGAETYMLIDLAGEDGDAAIVASNWIFDAVRATGANLLRRLADSPQATALGQAPRVWQPARDAGEKGSVGPLDAARLDTAGHGEISCTRIRTGRAVHALIFSAAEPGTIDAGRLPAALLSLSYALSVVSSGAPAAPSPVSERERECLSWVSEGKTAEEIATIVGVSINTVNSYVNLAIRKLSARNRAMAIATAIRAGVI